MSLIDSARMNILGDGLQVGANALLDGELLAQARHYKKNVAARYRLLHEADIQHLEAGKLHASLKLDGQLYFLAKAQGEIFLYNIQGRVITGLPLLDAAAAQLKGLEQALIAGELYFAAAQRPRARAVSAALLAPPSALSSSPQSAPPVADGARQAEGLAFAAFDVLTLNKQPCLGLSFADKQGKLAELFATQGPCHRAEQFAVDKPGLAQLYKEWVVDGGQEGIICVDGAAPGGSHGGSHGGSQSPSHRIFKIKPQHTVDAVILGFTELPDVADSIRVLLTGLIRPDGSFQVFTQVGSGFDDEQRRALFTQLSAMAVSSAFKTTDRNHSLFTMVRPEIVIELAFHDVIDQTTAGKAEFKPVLKYAAAEGYHSLLPQAFVTVLSPVFQRLREDKSANPEDLRLTQLQDLVDLDNLEQGGQSVQRAASTVLQREVYSKTTKGLVAVRKFIMWKTNKETIDATYPAYVFCFVDYSPGRKAPLKRVLRSAPSEAGIAAIFQHFKTTEIKRGWKPAA